MILTKGKYHILTGAAKNGSTFIPVYLTDGNTESFKVKIGEAFNTEPEEGKTDHWLFNLSKGVLPTGPSEDKRGLRTKVARTMGDAIEKAIGAFLAGEEDLYTCVDIAELETTYRRTIARLESTRALIPEGNAFASNKLDDAIKSLEDTILFLVDY